MLSRRMKRELEMLSHGAAPGIAAWPCGDSMDHLEGEIVGADGTPYSGGVFRVDVQVPAEYPLKPPSVRFVTKIYHPNIDSEGRICLDTLNMPPKGAWKPSLNIATVLTTIQALMSTPNPDDGLMPEISEQFRKNHTLFTRTARTWTEMHAKGASSSMCKQEDHKPSEQEATAPAVNSNENHSKQVTVDTNASDTTSNALVHNAHSEKVANNSRLDTDATETKTQVQTTDTPSVENACEETQPKRQRASAQSQAPSQQQPSRLNRLRKRRKM